MQTLKNKYLIKIPKHITMIYSENKKILVLSGPLGTKSLKPKVKILFSNDKKTILISSVPSSKISNKEKKNLNAIRGTIKSTIKLFFIETTSMLYQKLKLVGVGYRVFYSENLPANLITFKLGYSHQIYVKTSKKINLFCLKLTKLFIFGNSFQEITRETSEMRVLKKPEPYKGKGILYESEKIKLKEGKKI